MARITFFRQARRDGGVRTGIDIDHDTVLSTYDTGEDRPNPSLIWYVDLRFEGPRLPRSAETARQWLIAHSTMIERHLLKLARRLSVGIDPDDLPILQKVHLGGATMTIACSAVRRAEAKKIGSILQDIASHWKERLQTLPERIAC